MDNAQVDTQYQSYNEEVRGAQMANSLRSGIVIVVTLYSPFILLDYFVYLPQFFQLVVARVSIALVLMGAYVAAPLAPKLVTQVSVLAVGLNLVAVIGIAGGVSSLYFPGIMLLFLGMPVLLPLSAKQAAGLVFSLFGAFASLPFFGAGEFATREYFVNLFFPGAAAVEAVFSCALLDRLRFRDYCRTQEIALARDELAKLDDAKTRFSANVHHELRTPLTLMIAPIEGLRAGEYGNVGNAVHKTLSTMHSNGQRLLKLINNLLDLSKLENQKFSIVRGPVELEDILTELIDGTRPLAERKEVSIESENLNSLESVFVDREAIDKVFMNLIGNALKFTESGGSILVSGENVDDGVELRVEDTGIGIAEDQLDRIFDRFAQVDTSATRLHEGTGIGLSLASELVRLHAGRMWATSDGPGCGTAMHVFIPRGEADSLEEDLVLIDPSEGPDESLGSKAISASGSRDRFVEVGATVDRWEDQSLSKSVVADEKEYCPTSGVPILVVDDNADMRELLVHILGKQFSVRCARNGREALEAMEDFEPYLVVTDVMMPEMSGTELCQRIKESDRFSHIPVMIVSSKAEGEMKVRGLELGADDYVTKPFHPREVLARARSLVSLRVAQIEVAERNSALEDALEELGNTQAQLVQSERLAAVGELAAGIAHEVNNPINFSLNAAKALEKSVEDLAQVSRAAVDLSVSGEGDIETDLRDFRYLVEKLEPRGITKDVVELADIIIGGLGRTSKLVGDLRDFASPTTNLKWETVDLRSEAQSVVELFAHEASRLGISLVVEVGEIPLVVAGDQNAIGQILINFIKNAIEAIDEDERDPSREPPAIKVEAISTEQDVGIVVVDNGPGISDEIRARLFDPFFTTKQVGRGTGLGLSVCKGIAGSHSGHVDVETAVGLGSSFSLVIPRGK